MTKAKFSDDERHGVQKLLDQSKILSGRFPHRPILPDPPKGSPGMSTVDPSSTVKASEKIGLYGKALSAAVVAAMGAYSTAIQDGPGVTASEWIAVVLAFLASFGVVWAIPLTPRVLATYGKLIFSGLSALGASLITGLLDGGLSQAEVITALIAFAAASGLTGSVSNAASSDPIGYDGRQVAVPGTVKDSLVLRDSAVVVNNGNVVRLVEDAVGEPEARIKMRSTDEV